MMKKVKINGKTETVNVNCMICPDYECFKPVNKGSYWECDRKECPKNPVRKVVRHG